MGKRTCLCNGVPSASFHPVPGLGGWGQASPGGWACEPLPAALLMAARAVRTGVAASRCLGAGQAPSSVGRGTSLFLSPIHMSSHLSLTGRSAHLSSRKFCKAAPLPTPLSSFRHERISSEFQSEGGEAYTFWTAFPAEALL